MSSHFGIATFPMKSVLMLRSSVTITVRRNALHFVNESRSRRQSIRTILYSVCFLCYRNTHTLLRTSNVKGGTTIAGESDYRWFKRFNCEAIWNYAQTIAGCKVDITSDFLADKNRSCPLDLAFVVDCLPVYPELGGMDSSGTYQLNPSTDCWDTYGQAWTTSPRFSENPATEWGSLLNGSHYAWDFSAYSGVRMSRCNSDTAAKILNLAFQQEFKKFNGNHVRLRTLFAGHSCLL